MSEYEAILQYKTSMALFKRWRADGVINDADLAAMDTALAQKYGLSSKSIFRENDLLCKENRVIYRSPKGGHHEPENNEN